jgi:hypothetical protein
MLCFKSISGALYKALNALFCLFLALRNIFSPHILFGVEMLRQTTKKIPVVNKIGALSSFVETLDSLYTVR